MSDTSSNTKTGYENIGAVAPFTSPIEAKLSIYNLEQLIQGLDCLVTHHNEYNYDVTQLGSIIALAAYLDMLRTTRGVSPAKVNSTDQLMNHLRENQGKDVTQGLGHK